MPAILVGSGRTIPYMFNEYQNIYRLNTAFTDIARFVSIDFMRETRNKILDIDDCNSTIHSEFRRCKEIEQNNGGVPVEAKATDIQYPNAVSMLPFPLVIPVTSHNEMIPLNENGIPSSAKDVIPAGMVAGLPEDN
jgi:hypothetical protein